MFTLKSKYGNLIKRVETEREKENLLDKGYILVEEQTKKVNLNKMRGSELKTLAESKGIDLSDCKNREEELTKIKEAIGK